MKREWILISGVLLAGVFLLVHPTVHGPASPPAISADKVEVQTEVPAPGLTSVSSRTTTTGVAGSVQGTAPSNAPVELELGLADDNDSPSQDVVAAPDENALLRKLRELAAGSFKDAEAAALTLPA